MKRLFSIVVVTMMVLQGGALLALGQAGPTEVSMARPDPSWTDVGMEAVPTFGNGRMSRDYEDLSAWRGVDDLNVSVSYLIVMPSGFVDASKPFAEWKTEKGLNTAIVTTDAIYSKYTGLDDAQKIHNYLRDFRANNPTFKWLLLLGDDQYVPARHLWTDAGDNVIDWYIQDSTVSDFYYSALDSSWNLDNDNTWGEAGEVDWTPDVYVGRFPVDIVDEVSLNLGRTLDYEKEPQVGPWMNKALLAGGLYDVPNIIGDYSTRAGHGYYEWWQDNGKEGIDVVETHIPSHMSLTTMHDYNVSGSTNPPYEGGSWSLQDDELNRTGFVSAFNGGVSVIGSATHAWVNGIEPYYYSRAVIQYEGNGSEIYDDTPGSPWRLKYKDLYNSDDAKAASNGGMLPLWYASACLVGNFSQGQPGSSAQESMTFENFFKNQNGGVIGLVSAAHGDYRGERDNFTISDGDTWLLMNFFDLFFDEGEHRPGKTLYESKIAYRSHLMDDLEYSNQVASAGFARDSMFVYILLGDPEVPIWTDTPGTLTAEHPTDIYTGPQDIEVIVKDSVSGLPVKDATVALMGQNKGEQVYTYARTGTDGKATLHTEAASPDTIDVTVTAHNYMFWEGTMDVNWKPGDLFINTANVTFSKDLVKVGENVDITARVFNIGESPLSSVLVGFYLGDPGAGGTEIGTKTIASLSKGEDSAVSVTWTGKDGKNMICVVVDPSDAIAEYDEFNNKACKQIEGTSKDLFLTDGAVTFEGATMRGDGTPMVGNNTTVKVVIKVDNLGSTNVTVSYIRLFDGDPDAGGERIGISDYRVDDVPPGGSRTIKVPWNVTGAGMHTIYAISDPNDAIKEFDETNNNATAQVYSDLPPTMAPIDDIVLQEDDVLGAGMSAFCMFTLIDDPDNTYEELNVYIVTNTNPNIQVNLTNDCVDIVPKKDTFGFTYVTMGANDTVFEVTRSFKVTVDPINDAPVLTNPGKVTGQEGVTFDLTIVATDPDPDDTLTFSDTSDLFEINPSTGRIFFTPVREQGGTHVIEISVTDGLETTSMTFMLTINVNNRPPILTIKEDEWVFEVGKSKKYTFKAEDPDNDKLQFSDDFPHADVNQGGYLVYTPTKEHKGEYTVNITVTDGFANVTRSVTIKVVAKASNGTGDGLGNLLWLLLLVIIIMVIIGAVAAAKMRSGKASKKETAYDQLYAEDEKQRAQMEAERRRKERLARRKEDDHGRGAREESEEEAQADEENGEGGPALSECPKCGSSKVMEMEDGEWMCLRCSKIFK